MASLEPQSALGDFYVESTCCTSCGVPQVVAPDLVGWIDGNQPLDCYWKKQPENERELQQAFAIFDGQELGCHRYRGNDPQIQQRVGLENCDHLEGVEYQGIRRWGALWEKIPVGSEPQAVSKESFLRRLWSKLTS